MKTRQNILLVAMYMMGCMLLIACDPPSAGDTSPGPVTIITIPIATIKVHIVRGESKLKVTEGGNCPSTSNKNGCIDVSKGNKAKVTFELTGKANWHFTQFEICNGTEATKKAYASTCSLEEDQRDDFEFTIDDTLYVKPNNLGIVKLSSFGSNLRAFKLEDKNRVEQDYFYSITVCPPGVTSPNDDCIHTDPPILNKGR